MTHSRNRSRKTIVVFLLACVCLTVAVAVGFRRPNATARAAIESILLADLSPQQKLKELAPYVESDENISTVHKRIAPNPGEEFRIGRPTELAYVLSDSSLVLAIREDGTVVGIGKHQHGIDDGTFWLTKPEW